jgi:hypothetical protein
MPMQRGLNFGKMVLAEFIQYGSRYWPLVFVLILLHLAYSLWALAPKNRAALTPVDSNGVALDCFFRRGYELEEIIFQGRLGGEYILTRLGARTCVHIKRWNKPLGAEPVQALAAARAGSFCGSAILISKEGFTRAARRAAALAGVRLLDLYLLDEELERLSFGVPAGMKAAAAAAKTRS